MEDVVLSPPKHVLIGAQALQGELALPPRPRGLVVFAHGSGSSRRSPRNRAVARTLQEHDLATLLFDLLQPAEADDRANVFDIDLLADRIADTIDWLGRRPALAHLPLGLFGASTGAAAALVAAARLPERVRAVVSRGGRPDLAGDALARVRAPTLLIVGAADAEVQDLNRQAYARLRGPKRIEIVPRASHLFLEAGALDAVVQSAGDWFGEHLAAAR